MTEELTSGVYEIKNTTNGKRYIGSSRNVPSRFSGHRSALKNNKHHNYHLQQAWNSYGESAFEFNPLLFVDEEELAEFEEVAIRACESHKPENGYNRTATGTGLESHKTTEERKREQSIISKKNWQDPEFRRKNLESRRTSPFRENSLKALEKGRGHNKKYHFFDELKNIGDEVILEEVDYDKITYILTNKSNTTGQKFELYELEDGSLKIIRSTINKRRIYNRSSWNSKHIPTLDQLEVGDEIIIEGENNPIRNSVSKYCKKNNKRIETEKLNENETLVKRVEIDKDIERGSKYGFPRLGVGDHLIFSGDEHDLENVKASAHAYARKHKIKVSTSVSDGNIKVTRIE